MLSASDFSPRASGEDDADWLVVASCLRDRGRQVIAHGVIGPPEECIIAGYEDGNFFLAKKLLVPFIPLADELAIVAGAMVGSCLGFLWFNCAPAQVFMGDSGSLPLGGLLGWMALVAKQELVLPLIAFVFVAELADVTPVFTYEFDPPLSDLPGGTSIVTQFRAAGPGQFPLGSDANDRAQLRVAAQADQLARAGILQDAQHGQRAHPPCSRRPPFRRSTRSQPVANRSLWEASTRAKPRFRASGIHWLSTCDAFSSGVFCSCFSFMGSPLCMMPRMAARKSRSTFWPSGVSTTTASGMLPGSNAS